MQEEGLSRAKRAPTSAMSLPRMPVWDRTLFVENRGCGGVKTDKEELADGNEDGKMFVVDRGLSREGRQCGG